MELDVLLAEPQRPTPTTIATDAARIGDFATASHHYAELIREARRGEELGSAVTDPIVPRLAIYHAPTRMSTRVG